MRCCIRLQITTFFFSELFAGFQTQIQIPSSMLRVRYVIVKGTHGIEFSGPKLRRQFVTKKVLRAGILQ